MSRNKKWGFAVLPLPRLAPLTSQHSVFTQTTHQILVSQFKNRPSSTILPFPAVSGLRISSLFQPLCLLVFSLLLSSSCPRCSVAEYLPVPKRITPWFSPRRMIQTHPRTTGAGRRPPPASPRAVSAQEAPVASSPTAMRHCKGQLEKIRLSLLQNSWLSGEKHREKRRGSPVFAFLE